MLYDSSFVLADPSALSVLAIGCIIVSVMVQWKRKNSKMLEERQVDQDVLKQISQMTRNKSEWVDYDNGNYHVWLNVVDGTKIRYTDDEVFAAAFPESMDIKITNKCSLGCPMCHEDSTANGMHSDIDQAFIDTLHPYQEIAVGGGNVLEHPQLEEYLMRLRAKKCIPSITVNQTHFMKKFDYIEDLYNRNLVFGIGVSLSDARAEGFIDRLQQLPTAVVHTIVGMLSPEDVKALAGNNLKVLLLGYKNIRRGAQYAASSDAATKIDRNTAWVGKNLLSMMQAFKVLSFDNLALDQLPVRQTVGQDVWEQFYMGDDGRHTFYIDMVEKQFARSSTSMTRYDIADKSVDEMFQVILAES